MSKESDSRLIVAYCCNTRSGPRDSSVNGKQEIPWIKKFIQTAYYIEVIYAAGLPSAGISNLFEFQKKYKSEVMKK